MKKKVYIPIPKFDCYYGEKVTKDTVLDYENANVKQHLENLVLTTDYEVKNERFTSTVHNEIVLNDGEVILLEEEGRGYIVPKDGQRLGTFKDLKDEVKFFGEQLKKIKE